MKKKIITLTLIAALSATATTAFAAPIPRESAPLNATEAQIQITENIVGDILDEVQTGKLGYTLAAGYANTKIRKAVMANQTDGNGYGILSPIAQNAIRVMRDKQLRPDAYAKAEEELKVLIADVITAVRTVWILTLQQKRLMRKSINQQTHHLIMTSNFHLIPVIEIFPLSEWKCLQSQGNCYWRLP